MYVQEDFLRDVLDLFCRYIAMHEPDDLGTMGHEQRAKSSAVARLGALHQLIVVAHHWPRDEHEGRCGT